MKKNYAESINEPIIKSLEKYYNNMREKAKWHLTLEEAEKHFKNKQNVTKAFKNAIKYIENSEIAPEEYKVNMIDYKNFFKLHKIYVKLENAPLFRFPWFRIVTKRYAETNKLDSNDAYAQVQMSTDKYVDPRILQLDKEVASESIAFLDNKIKENMKKLLRTERVYKNPKMLRLIDNFVNEEKFKYTIDNSKESNISL